ncbi:LytR C-terminal domain-containing protein [Ruicaihuangia caeni]|uniref:LytR C-terminal domain-containing protein n=1 Tax=Ruicaihuangia caeni TaxID=3042517 RepID=UPI00338DAA20
MTQFPRDRFDDLPRVARVGAHRAQPRRGRGWVTFAWWVLAVIALTLAGLFALSRLSDQVSFEFPVIGQTQAPAEPTPTEPEVQPVTDPSTLGPDVSITVLNGTGTTGLAGAVGDRLTAEGWPIGSRTNAAQTDVETTTVYYGTPADEALARGLVLALGFGDVAQSDAFPGATVTIVLGADSVPDA